MLKVFNCFQNASQKYEKILLYAKNAFLRMNELFHTQVPNPLWYWYAPSLV
jgi:hypothetical protein